MSLYSLDIEGVWALLHPAACVSVFCFFLAWLCLQLKLGKFIDSLPTLIGEIDIQQIQQCLSAHQSDR
jgi:hypothetical protein